MSKLKQSATALNLKEGNEMVNCDRTKVDPPNIKKDYKTRFAKNDA